MVVLLDVLLPEEELQKSCRECRNRDADLDFGYRGCIHT